LMCGPWSKAVEMALLICDTRKDIKRV